MRSAQLEMTRGGGSKAVGTEERNSGGGEPKLKADDDGLVASEGGGAMWAHGWGRREEREEGDRKARGARSDSGNSGMESDSATCGEGRGG